MITLANKSKLDAQIAALQADKVKLLAELDAEKKAVGIIQAELDALKAKVASLEADYAAKLADYEKEYKSKVNMAAMELVASQGVMPIPVTSDDWRGYGNDPQPKERGAKIEYLKNQIRGQR